MEISLVLSDDSGSYSTLLGQFLETAVADTLNDRVLAQAAASAASNYASQADSSAEQSGVYASNSASSASAASASATAAANSASSANSSQTAASNSASNASVYASNASGSATAAANSATAASGSATAAAGSATSAANSASAASTTLANALIKTNNLSDVSSAATSLTNLGGASLSQLTTASQEYTVFLPTNTTQTLTSAVLGGVVYWYSATGGTLTLQQGSGAFQGAKLKLVNGNTGAVVVSTFSGDTMSINGTTFTSITLGPGDDLDLVRADTATRWDCVGGSARSSVVPLRVATATLSTHAVPLAQATSLAAAGLTLQAFTATVASSALTLTIPATTLQFRNSVITNGFPVSVTVSAALSLIVPSTATLGTVSATAAKLAVLALYDGTNAYVGVTNLAGSTSLDETSLISTTAISTSATSSSGVYSNSALTNVAFRIIGYVEITEATAGTWATAPTKLLNESPDSPIWRTGYGQTWQNVTASRTSGSSYVNLTGRAISVVIVNTATSSGSILPTVGGVAIGQMAVSITSPNIVSPYVSFQVPAGTAYSATVVSLSQWSELR